MNKAQIAAPAAGSQAGVFVLFQSVLGFGGGGGRGRRHRLRLFSLLLVAILGVLAFTAASAFAGAPAVISESASGVKASEARLEAVVDPGDEVTECHFQYGTASVTENEVQCEQAVIEGEEQGVGVTVVGLAEHTTYHYRVVLKNLKAEEATGNQEELETALTPETPVTEAAEKVTGNTATFRGELNPHVKATNGYYFAYNTDGGCTGGDTTAAGEETEVEERKVSTAVTGLEPLRDYSVCLVSTNAAGEEAVGNAVAFKTPAARPVVESESDAPFPASEANPFPRPANEIRLEAIVNPNNQATVCQFQYGTEPSLKNATTTVCEPGGLEGFGGQGVALNVTGLQENTTYYYRVVASNATGAEQGPTEQFETALSPSTPEEAAATGVTASTATLNGVLNPAGARAKEPGIYKFLYLRSSTECRYGPGEAEEKSLIPEAAINPIVERRLDEYRAKVGQGVTPNESAPASKEDAVNAEVSALVPEVPSVNGRIPLLPHTTYTFCLAVRNEAGEETVGPPETFTTSSQAPIVSGESSTEISLSGVTLTAQVNPGGLATTYHVEYGTSTGYDSTTPETSAGYATEPVAISAQLSGLEPGTLYDYRFVATNALGTVTDSENKTFTTLSPAPTPGQESCPNAAARRGPSATSPDCRAYEQLTPVNKGGAEDIFAPFRRPDGAVFSPAGGYPSEDGDRFLLTTTASLKDESAAGANAYVFSRGADGWSMKSLAAPGLGVQSISAGELLFSPELSRFAYRDDLGSQGGDTESARPEVILAGSLGESYATIEQSTNAESTLTGASADLSRVVFEGPNHLLAPGDSGQDPHTDALYESADGAECSSQTSNCKLVNVETDGALVSACGARLGLGVQSGGEHNAVSSDGSKIFFTAPEPSPNNLNAPGCWGEGGRFNYGQDIEELNNVLYDPPQVYMRVDGARTVDVSEPAPDAREHVRYPAVYAGASANGEKVFFLSQGELTADATSHDDELYEYDTQTGVLTRISHGDTGTAEGRVLQVPVISNDGSAVYFTSHSQLAPGAPPVPEGAPNNPYSAPVDLYRYDTNSEATTYIATIGADEYPADSTDIWWFPNALGRVFSFGLEPQGNWYSTPDGQYLAFASETSLTGFDNTLASGVSQAECPPFADGNGGTKCSEVYLYSAASNKLVCVSCDPGGKAPVSNAEIERSPVEGRADGPMRAVSEGGEYVFFDSGDALVPDALSGVLHVYEWHDGKVSLISAPGDPSASFFLGSSPSGSNVFFSSYSQLVPQDTDAESDLYDARIDGGFEGSAPPSCTGSGCQGVPDAPPVFATPASATFAGTGNFSSEPPAPPAKPVVKKTARCKKGFTRKKNKCVRTKAKKKAKKPSNERRVSR